MQFLKDSWANIAENEENEQNLLEDLEKQPAPSGFQLVTSKASKKGSVSKSQVPKGKHSNRSKGVLLKPSR
jgi:hypothetical protein